MTMALRQKLLPTVALILAACSSKAASNGPDASSPPAASTAAEIASAPRPAVSASAAPTAEPSTAPYLPPREGEKTEEPKRKAIGTFDDWVKAYEGIGSPERNKRPPRLGLPKDLAIKTGRIAFSRSGDIFSFDLATGVETQLTRNTQRNIDPVFLADGRRIAFLSNRDGMVFRVFLMNADGSDQKPITAKFVDYYGPKFAISPDGKSAAYVEKEGKEWPFERLHLVDVASGKDERIGDLDDVNGLTFSPKGDELFHVVGGFDAERIAALDIATKRIRLFSQAGNHMFDAPQQLGDRLLFSASGTAAFCCRNSRLFTTAPDGSGIHQLGPFEVPGSMHVTISPRGSKLAIAWSAREGGFGADWRTEIAILDANGILQRSLTDAFPRPFYSAFEPTWAPDDRHLAFTLSLCPYVGCEPTIRSVVVVDTTNPKAVPAFIGYGGGASWSPVP